MWFQKSWEERKKHFAQPLLHNALMQMIPTDIKVHCWLVLNSSIKIPCFPASSAQCRHWLPHHNCKTSLLSLLNMKRFVSSLFQCPESPHLAETSLHPLIQMTSKVMKQYNPYQIPILYGCQKFQLLTTTVLLQQHRRLLIHLTLHPHNLFVCLFAWKFTIFQGR